MVIGGIGGIGVYGNCRTDQALGVIETATLIVEDAKRVQGFEMSRFFAQDLPIKGGSFGKLSRPPQSERVVQQGFAHGWLSTAKVSGVRPLWLRSPMAK